MVRRHIADFALQGRQFHRFQPGAITLQAVQLIGYGHFHFPPRGGCFQLRGGLRRGAELWAAMHHHDLGRDVLERQRPIHRRITTTRNHHALAAKFFPLRHHVANGARDFVPVKPGQGRAIGTEGAGASGQDHCLGANDITGGSAENQAAAFLTQALNPPAEKILRREGCRLFFQLANQVSAGDLRMGGNVENRFFGIKRRALPADCFQGVNHHGFHAQHAAFKHREKPDRARANNRDIGFNLGRHGLSPESRGRDKAFPSQAETLGGSGNATKE